MTASAQNHCHCHHRRIQYSGSQITIYNQLAQLHAEPSRCPFTVSGSGAVRAIFGLQQSSLTGPTAIAEKIKRSSPSFFLLGNQASRATWAPISKPRDRDATIQENEDKRDTLLSVSLSDPSCSGISEGLRDAIPSWIGNQIQTVPGNQAAWVDPGALQLHLDG